MLIIFNTLAKFSSLPLEFIQRSQYPMSMGILGSIVQVLAISNLIWPKLLLGAIVVRLRPYLYPAITVLELLFILMFSKLTRKQIDFVFSVLPSTFTVTLFNYGNTSGRFKCLEKFVGAISTVFLHYSTLIFIYVPIYYLLNIHLDEEYEKSSIIRMYELGTVIWYVVGVVPYLGFLAIYHVYVKRWKKVEEIPDVESCITTNSTLNDTPLEHEQEMLP